MLQLNLNERADCVPSWLTEVKPDLSRVWQYPTNRVDYENKIADFWGINGEQVILTNGADEGISLLFQYAQRTKRRMLIPMPMFSQYWYSISLWDIDAVALEPTSELRMDIDAVLTNMQAGDIVMLTTPNNPTGERLTDEQITSVREKARAIKATLIIDEAYSDFSDDNTRHLELLNTNDDIVLIRTFSKAYGVAGCRLGYLMGNSPLIDAIRDLTMPFNVSRPALEIIDACLSDNAQTEVKNYCKTIMNNRDELMKILSNKGFSPFDGQGNFVFCTADNKDMVESLYTHLLDNNIMIKTDFVGMATDFNTPCMRITVPFYTDTLFTVLNSWGGES
ncbi:MAG: histidinol-phosphate aminotransferase family protein [Gammaproteobacteria bacterium]|nr:histidinol-phosphate aminotransferase family protein [Gammaproteobacteria bacterium]